MARKAPPPKKKTLPKKTKKKAKAKKARVKAPPATSPLARSIPPDADGSRFDRRRYEVPILNLAEAIVLAERLLATIPPRPTSAIVEEADDLREALARAKDLHESTAMESASIDARPFDVAMDRAWATFVRRIRDHAELAEERHPSALVARRVYALVKDLSILKLNYQAEYAQIGARLDDLKREGLYEEACALAGTAFLDEVLACHSAYGEALGLPVSDGGEARLVLLGAIEEYAYQVLALARPGRPEGWMTVDASLAPIRELTAPVPLPPPPPLPPPHPPTVTPDLE